MQGPDSFVECLGIDDACRERCFVSSSAR